MRKKHSDPVGSRRRVRAGLCASWAVAIALSLAACGANERSSVSGPSGGDANSDGGAGGGASVAGSDGVLGGAGAIAGAGSGFGGGSGSGAGGTGGTGGVPIELGPLLPTDVWPKTIPAIREWHAYGTGAGAFVWTATSAIVVAAGAPSSLLDAANTLADDLNALTGVRPEVTAAGIGKNGDIVLALDLADAAVGDEGYVLTVDTRATVHANHIDGAFWATRTFLQLLAQDKTRSITFGAARDWPSYPERGFMIDNGRTYFSPEWLENQIRELSYLKLNLFHWHLADGAGFRIESPSHPEIVSAEHLTRAQVSEAVALAQPYHVEVVPELDMPGHMDAVLALHPDLVATQSTYPGKQLDYTKDEARLLAKTLIQESIALYPGRYWHLGTDEFTPYFDAAWDFAQKKYGNNPQIGGLDVAIGFVNELAAVVESNGKQARVWNDVLAPHGVVEKLDPRIIWEDWIDRGTPLADLAAAGFSILNCNSECTYSTGEATVLGSACALNRFAGGSSLPVGSPTIRGSKYHVWCDPAPDFCPDEPTVSANVRMPLLALAQVTWGSPELALSVAELDARAALVGRSPGFAH